MHPIAFYRKAAGLTQTELGERLGVSITTVQEWEKGAGPRPKNLPPLAAALGVETQALLTEIEEWRHARPRPGTAPASP